MGNLKLNGYGEDVDLGINLRVWKITGVPIAYPTATLVSREEDASRCPTQNNGDEMQYQRTTPTTTEKRRRDAGANN